MLSLCQLWILSICLCRLNITLVPFFLSSPAPFRHVFACPRWGVAYVSWYPWCPSRFCGTMMRCTSFCSVLVASSRNEFSEEDCLISFLSSSPVPVSAAISAAELKLVRDQFVSVLTRCLGGDELAAEYLLCFLLSGVSVSLLFFSPLFVSRKESSPCFVCPFFPSIC